MTEDRPTVDDAGEPGLEATLREGEQRLDRASAALAERRRTHGLWTTGADGRPEWLPPDDDVSDVGTVEIAIYPPGPPGTQPWWTVRWNGTRATVKTAPGLDGDTPEAWGMHCTSPAYTDAWRDEGGTPYVVEQVLDVCAGAGATAKIIAIHGEPDARRRTLAALAAFANEHPQCAAELRRAVADWVDLDRST